MMYVFFFIFFFSSRRRHTRLVSDWSSDVCSSDLFEGGRGELREVRRPGRRGAARLRRLERLEGRRRQADDAGRCEIGRASVGKECRSRWSPYQEKKKENETEKEAG